MGHLLIFSIFVVKFNGKKIEQSHTDRMTNGPDPSGMKIWITPLTKVFVEGTAYMKE